MGNINIKREVSKKIIKPSENRCNATLMKRDGYCSKPGVAKYARCKYHGGNRMNEDAKGLFKLALGINKAAELEKLILDTESMDGEIAIQKTELLESLKDKVELKRKYKELLNERPLAPKRNDFEDLVEYDDATKLYKIEVRSYLTQLKNVKEEYRNCVKDIHFMLEHISRAVERNNKVLHGKKYTININQLTGIIHTQLDVFQRHCLGCAKLKEIAKEMGQLKIRGVGNLSELASAHEKTVGKKRGRPKKEMAVEADYEEI